MCAKHSDIGSVWVSTLLHKIFLGDFYLVLCAEFPWQDCWWWIELRLRVSWDHSPTTHQLQHLEQVIYPLSKLQFLRHRNDVILPELHVRGRCFQLPNCSLGRMLMRALVYIG